MGIVKSLFSRKGSKKEAAAATRCQPTVTKLMMLMPDASGIATYQLHTFVAASEAEAYLVSILRGEVQEGTIMFWGLTSLPSRVDSRDVEAEPVVLIRDPNRPGLVYTFSFVDLDSAHDFVRHEIKDGLDLAQTSIFWAVPAEATADHWGQITVTPSRPPTQEPAPTGGALLAPPTPFVPPDHGEPNEDHQHIDETPPVRQPELVSDEPDAADEPETIDELAAAAEPADEVIDGTDISKVIDILQARGLRKTSSPPEPNDEPEGIEDTADGPSDAGNGVAHADDEAIHIELSDVFGGRPDPEPPAILSDFRRDHKGRQVSDVDAAPDSAMEAPAETVRGIVAAWSNIGAAIDRAIDAHVARRVSATIAWRRLTDAFVAAAGVRLLVTWRALTQALYARSAVQPARERAASEAGRDASRAIHQAADSNSGHRAMHLAWANISWTLEEAVQAAGLQQKNAAASAWSTASSAVAVAAIRKNAINSGLRTAWHRLAVEILNAAKAQQSRRARVVFAWASIGTCLSDAAGAMYRHDKIVFAWASTGIALNEFVSAKLHDDGLVAAWTRLAAAFGQAAGATARRDRAVARAWHRLTRAFAKVANARMLVTWRAITRALYQGAAVKAARDRALAEAWRNATRAIHQVAESKSGRRARRLAWANISWTLEEAVYAARLQQKKAAARAWPNASSAIAVAVRKKDAVDRGLRTAWTRLSVVIEAAAAENVRRNALISARRSVSLEARADAHIKADQRERAAIQAWDNATLALNEAGVAEAQVRIAEAGLSGSLMRGVISAIRKVKGGRKSGSVAGKAARKAVGVAAGAPSGTAKKTAREKAAKGSTSTKTAAKATKTRTTKKATNGRSKAKDSPQAAAEKRSTADARAAAMESWRSRESGRFSKKSGKFESFDSPPGRF